MTDSLAPEKDSLFGAEMAVEAEPPVEDRLASAKTVIAHPAVRLVLLVIALAVALPYILASAPPAPAGTAAAAGTMGAGTSGTSNMATFGALPPGDETLQVVQSSFDPVLVERLEADKAGNPLDAATASNGPPGVTTEMLRIIAQMTPEQIDALTFLLLSQQDPKAAASAADGTAAVEGTADAPWIGDWSGDDQDPPKGALAGVETIQNELLRGWHVYDASADEAVIRSVDDPLSAIAVAPGTVVGNIGTVVEIRLEADVAKVVLSNGDVIVSDATSAITFEPPPAPEQRSGPPFEVWGADAPAAAVIPATDSGALDAVAPAETAFAAADGSITPPQPTAAAPGAVQAARTSTKQDAALSGRYVQVASFKSIQNAEIARTMLASGGIGGQIDKSNWRGSSYHRVLAGPFDPADIRSALTRVNGLGFKDAFILR